MRFVDFAADARALAETLPRAAGRSRWSIGASLGGISALTGRRRGGAAGQAGCFARSCSSTSRRGSISPASPRSRASCAHMRPKASRSVAEAADAVAAYLPHRPRPRSQEGLKKNLRLHPDGRWRWHWDPRFLDGRRAVSGGRDAVEAAMIEAARRVKIPTLLVRGASSELVTRRT